MKRWLGIVWIEDMPYLERKGNVSKTIYAKRKVSSRKDNRN